MLEHRSSFLGLCAPRGYEALFWVDLSRIHTRRAGVGEEGLEYGRWLIRFEDGSRFSVATGVAYNLEGREGPCPILNPVGQRRPGRRRCIVGEVMVWDGWTSGTARVSEIIQFSGLSRVFGYRDRSGDSGASDYMLIQLLGTESERETYRQLMHHRRDWAALQKVEKNIRPGLRYLAYGANLEDASPLVFSMWSDGENERRGLPPKNLINPKMKTPVILQCKHPGESHLFEISLERAVKSIEVAHCLGTIGGRPSIRETHPELSSRWDWELNQELLFAPHSVTAGSEVAPYLRCTQGDNHSYQMSVRAATSQDQGCSVHAGRQVWKGFNDLLSQDPQRAKQWHPDLNETSPDEHTATSGHAAWWVCPLGHDPYQMPIVKRTVQMCDCPRCHVPGGTSKRELRLLESLVSAGFNAEHGVVVEVGEGWFSNKARPDIVVDKRIHIEYDGAWYHHRDESIARDVRKTLALLNRGDWVIRLREQGSSPELRLPPVPIEHPRLIQFKIGSSEDLAAFVSDHLSARITQILQAHPLR